MRAARKGQIAARYAMAAAFSLTAVLASGCVGERAFFISANYSQCVPGDAENAVGLSVGTLDTQGAPWIVSSGRGYLLYPELRNDMLASAGTDGEPERNRLILRRFEVDLDLGVLGQGVGVPAQLTSFAVPATGLIEPGGSLLVAGVPLVPAALVDILSRKQLPTGGGLITAKVQAVADHNGSDLKSLEFEYPIQICSGCLMVSNVAADCPPTQPAATSNACGHPQDDKVFCCANGATCYSQAELSALPAAP